MALNSQQFYNGYRSVFEGQKQFCIKQWVKYFYRVFNNGSNTK